MRALTCLFAALCLAFFPFGAIAEDELFEESVRFVEPGLLIDGFDFTDFEAFEEPVQSDLPSESPFDYLAAFPDANGNVAGATGENLVINPDFSELDENGQPVGWRTDSYSSNNTQFSVGTIDGTDKRCAVIYNFYDNDARWIQEIPVEPDTEYVIRACLRADNCASAHETLDGVLSCRGANVSILNSATYTESYYNTRGEWVEALLYGVTGGEQTSLTLALRLGGYSGDGTGRAYFTDVSMRKCATPAGYLPVSLSTYEPFTPSNDQSFGSAPSLPDRITEALILMCFGFLVFYLALIAMARRESASDSLSPSSGTKPVSVLGALMLIAFAIRVYFGARIRGYSVDITDFMIWGENFLNDGARFYEASGLHDYPPLYMALLGLMSSVRRILGIQYDSTAHLLLIKLIPMLCDLGIAALLYARFEKRAGCKRALILAAFVLFNPAFIADSAAWGQVDSVMTLLVCLCLCFAADGKWHLSLPFFVLSLLSKPQAMLFGPIGLAALVADAYKNRRKPGALGKMLAGLMASLVIAYAFSAPFAFQSASGVFAPFAWLWKLLLGSTSTYRYLTVNACNLYVLFDRNWANMDWETGLSAFAWGMFAASYVYSGFLVVRSRNRRALPLIGAALISAIFAFAPMMHERYLFPAIAFLLVAYVEFRDWRILAAAIAVTLTQFLNIALVLQGGTVAEYASFGHLQASEDSVNCLISAVNVLEALFVSWTAYDIVILKNILPIKPVKRALEKPDTPAKRLVRPQDWKMRLRPRDYVIMAAFTLVYGAVAFTGLGSTSAPQTFWQNHEFMETVTFDLGEERTFRMTYYGGISNTPFTVSLSNDGEQWTEETYAYFKDGECFRWIWFQPQNYQYGNFSPAYSGFSEARDTGESGARLAYVTANAAYPLQTARFVRIKAMGIGLVLGEFGFWDVENEALYPIHSVTGSVPGADYSALIDEQDTVAFAPSYTNGTYFDEIYHARTAYELLHGMNVLEWSHPHLGKLIIMLGIRLFGMTPFGWRCMGTLIGVLMLPVFYLLIMQLTKKTRLALLGTFLLSVDSMHFTQTRIATIDSYPVFFIMLMYLFMFRYFQMNLHREKLPKTLVPLGLSGLFMGFACASKWIGIYAAAGLAVIFFISVILRLREYACLRSCACGKTEINGLTAQDARTMARAFPKKLILTLLFCVLAFVVVPLVIYCLCYIRHFASTDSYSIKNIWDLQVSMLNYHSGLGNDTHPFRSPWYEWPFIIRPMWYYSADIAYTGRNVISSISCMGNPAVWWTGLFAILTLFVVLAVKTRPDVNLLLIAIGFLAQFLPWVFVPRSTFIYHYFASVPFIIIATVLMYDELRKKRPFLADTACLTVAALALIAFIAFYPLESGAPCAYEYALKLRWFRWINFQLR